MAGISDPLPKISIAIPLYRSEKFIDTIISNITSVTADGVEFLISDRHCYDGTIDNLAAFFADDPRVKCIKAKDKLD